MKKSPSNKFLCLDVIERKSYELVPAFKDPEFCLLEIYGRKEKLSILKIRRISGCSISEAIESFKSRQKNINKSKKKKRKKAKKLHNSSDGVGNSVITSLAGRTSARNWKTVK
ncbi:hypothetical protein [Thalassotalea sp. PS06]|uniref:hypothetical protein n=1 Tax=Thalassotalea sp. PS06 TaxID=2594005 RepID=UPI001162311C|nr:hypothetical protein [Thalassotalea sp. PS06]QDP00236.1 hypothetical protein FNC98_02035 [Thalassotalea sp. PS06]